MNVFGARAMAAGMVSSARTDTILSGSGLNTILFALPGEHVRRSCWWISSFLHGDRLSLSPRSEGHFDATSPLKGSEVPRGVSPAGPAAAPPNSSACSFTVGSAGRAGAFRGSLVDFFMAIGCPYSPSSSGHLILTSPLGKGSEVPRRVLSAGLAAAPPNSSACSFTVRGAGRTGAFRGSLVDFFMAIGCPYSPRSWGHFDVTSPLKGSEVPRGVLPAGLAAAPPNSSACSFTVRSAGRAGAFRESLVDFFMAMGCPYSPSSSGHFDLTSLLGKGSEVPRGRVARRAGRGAAEQQRLQLHGSQCRTSRHVSRILVRRFLRAMPPSLGLGLTRRGQWDQGAGVSSSFSSSWSALP